MHNHINYWRAFFGGIMDAEGPPPGTPEGDMMAGFKRCAERYFAREAEERIASPLAQAKIEDIAPEGGVTVVSE